MFEAKYLVETAIDPFYRSSPVISILPLKGGSGDRCEDSAVQFERYANHSTEVTHAKISFQLNKNGCVIIAITTPGFGPFLFGHKLDPINQEFY